MKTIFLCGFMGCGKTTVGKKLAKNINVPFIDMDDYIVKSENKTIPEIFTQFGEPYFRHLEAAAITNLSTINGAVVATGGGALLNPDTSNLAKSSGYVIFINTSFERCYQRIKGDKNRPLVMKNSRAELLNLYKNRKLIYMSNSHKNVNGNVSAKIITELIQKLLEEELH